ncbi:MAG: hypothetical protein ACOCT9_00335 [archaeon]
MGENWWETHTKKRSKRSSIKRRKKRSLMSEDIIFDEAEKAADDIAETINPNEEDKLLTHAISTVSILITLSGKSFAKSFNKIIDWGWPTE